ncbi:MAG: N,N-dimethylformamidase beta subunit family domain-containing protein [Gaiellaceae bacterium]
MRLPLAVLALAVVPAAVDRSAPVVTDFHVRAEGRAFAGDRQLLATISPNGDGVRDRVAITFRLSEPARVHLTIAKTVRKSTTVYARTGRFTRGRHTIYWAPRELTPRTYLVRLSAVDRAGNRATHGAGSAGQLRREGGRTPVVRILGIDAGFERPSYDAGQNAGLRIESDATRLSVQLFRAGAESIATTARNVMHGVAVSEPIVLPWAGRRHGPQRVRFRIPALPSGVYFAQLTADDGRVGYAPFIVRAPGPSTARVAVVMPTNTWQAYNFRDEDADGWGDTWYAGVGSAKVRLGRAFLDRGVPPKYRAYDVGFLRWLHETGRAVDFLAEEDLERAGGGDRLAAAYDLIVFPGHTEYVTRREYDVVERFRDLGGNLMFLSANNFFWQVERKGRQLRKVRKWRDLGRPEAALIGAQYLANDEGKRKGSYVVLSAMTAPWLWEGTILVDGSSFGELHGGFGIEIDATTRDTPRGTIVLAEVPEIYGPRYTGQMTYYETAAGAKVFAAGTLDFGGRARYRPVKRILSNLWTRLSQP